MIIVIETTIKIIVKLMIMNKIMLFDKYSFFFCLLFANSRKEYMIKNETMITMGNNLSKQISWKTDQNWFGCVVTDQFKWGLFIRYI